MKYDLEKVQRQTAAQIRRAAVPGSERRTRRILLRVDNGHYAALLRKNTARMSLSQH